ncbi:CHAT domain-containing protein [Nonomuraea wenchangensis]|uniref:CHAT domain-containing protein n=1 Tax=Nonomuraea wenchangensis TaxID=568860 RepID=UPI00378D235B
MRQALLSVVAARVLEMSATGDLSAISDPEATRQARALADSLAAEDLPEVRVVLGWWHWLRYGGTGDPGEFHRAVELLVPCFLLEIDALPEPMLPSIAVAASVPAVDLLRRSFEDGADPQHLSAVVRLWQRITAAVPAGGREQGLYQSLLSSALLERFLRAGDDADLEAALQASERALRAGAEHDPSNPRPIFDHAQLLLVRHRRSGRREDLAAAAACVGRAVEIAPPGEVRASVLFELGQAFQLCYLASGERNDLDVAVATLSLAFSAGTPGDDWWDPCVVKLGGLLAAQYEHFGDVPALNLMIEVYGKASAADPDDRWRGLLAMALHHRFKRSGQPEDLDEAVRLGDPGPGYVPSDGADAERLAQWAAILQTRFEEHGDPADLNACLDAHRRALRAPGPHPAHRHSGYANSLRARYQQTGDLADLDESVSVHRQALDLAQGSPGNDLPMFSSNLGLALVARFERTAREDDLDEAVELHRRAASAGSRDDVRWGLLHANLGGALMRCVELRATTGERAESGGDPGAADDDLGEAIEALRAAVAAAPPGHRDRGRYLVNLSSALVLRQQRTSEHALLAEAEDLLREAVTCQPDGHPDQASVRLALGQVLRARFDREGGDSRRAEAVSAFVRAAENGAAPLPLRIQAYQAASSLVAESAPGRAADLLEAAVRLLPHLAARQLGRDGQQDLLKEFRTLTGEAAALALTRPESGPAQAPLTGTGPAQALRLLETGRAVLLSQALDVRADLSALRERDPELARRYLELNDRLSQPQGPAVPGPRPLSAADPHHTAQELSETVAAIRRLDGFATFLEPPTLGELLDETAQGPIVAFNLSRTRGDALLLTSDGVRALPLPGMDATATLEKVIEFYGALHITQTGTTLSERATAQAAMNEVLEWLWRAAARPVLDALRLGPVPAGGGAWPRIWWASGGILSLLPLHAAGVRGSESDAVLHRVVSSYVPTVRALRYARRPLPPGDGRGGALVVAMPTTPGGPDLEHASAEASAVAGHLPHAVVLAPGEPREPTRETVLSHLATSSIAHFACHGAIHPTDLSRSMLVLQDHATDPLTVAALNAVRLEHAELAYLSACVTATGPSAHLADEAIHLATGFQLAGFRNVVGTLWEIQDEFAVDLADAFYRGLTTGAGTIDPARSAFALHHAVRERRARHPRTPSLWAAHIHVGA